MSIDAYDKILTKFREKEKIDCEESTMGLFKKKSKEEKLFNADKVVKNFCKGKKNLSEKEHKKLSGLLKKRAKASSDVFGVKISSISYKDAKKFRDRNK